MKKIIIAGGRDFDDFDLLNREVIKFSNDNKINCDETIIVSGCAKGADALGAKFAKNHGLELLEFPANWDKHGKSAGYIRNAAMAKEADALIAFWDGKSRGTRHMINTAHHKKLKVHIVKYAKETS